MSGLNSRPVSSLAIIGAAVALCTTTSSPVLAQAMTPVQGTATAVDNPTTPYQQMLASISTPDPTLQSPVSPGNTPDQGINNRRGVSNFFQGLAQGGGASLFQNGKLNINGAVTNGISGGINQAAQSAAADNARDQRVADAKTNTYICESQRMADAATTDYITYQHERARVAIQSAATTANINQSRQTAYQMDMNAYQQMHAHFLAVNTALVQEGKQPFPASQSPSLADLGERDPYIITQLQAAGVPGGQQAAYAQPVSVSTATPSAPHVDTVGGGHFFNTGTAEIPFTYDANGMALVQNNGKGYIINSKDNTITPITGTISAPQEASNPTSQPIASQPSSHIKITR